MAPAGRAMAKKALAHSAPAGFVSSRKVREGREVNLTRRRGEAVHFLTKPKTTKLSQSFVA